MYLLGKNHDGHYNQIEYLCYDENWKILKIDIFQERCVAITAIPIELRN